MSGKGVGGKRFRAKVISIKPEYAKLIYAGKKNWEFRKKAPKIYCSYYVYESAPVSRITGFVTLGVRIEGVVSVVYDFVTSNTAYEKNLPGIGYPELVKYAGENGVVTAVRILVHAKFENLKLIGRPPQNFGEREIEVMEEGGAK